MKIGEETFAPAFFNIICLEFLKYKTLLDNCNVNHHPSKLYIEPSFGIALGKQQNLHSHRCGGYLLPHSSIVSMQAGPRFDSTKALTKPINASKPSRWKTFWNHNEFRCSSSDGCFQQISLVEKIQKVHVLQQ